MAAFRVHEEREEPSLPCSSVAAAATAAPQRRHALVALDQNAVRERPVRLPKLQVENNAIPTNNENRPALGAKNKKPVQPPVAQFEAFSVYENVFEEKENPSKGTSKNNVKPKEKYIPPGVLKLHSQRICSPKKSDKDIEEDVTPSNSKGNQRPVTTEEKSEVKRFEEKKATAKTLREQFFHVVQYREEIYNYMREIEIKYRSRSDYMRKQADITHSMRAILVDWLVEVSEEYRLQTETLYLAVSYIDRFLSYMSVVRAKLQLVGTTAMFIASKYEEIYPPELGEFVYITDETYTKQQVLRMEHLILKVLSFDLSTPTPLAFISLFCISNGLSQRTLFLSMYISELALLEAEPYLQYPASILGASALAVARHTLLCCHCSQESSCADSETSIRPTAACNQAAWPSALQRSSGYELANLDRCMRELARTHAGATEQPHQAIVEKYRNSKYEGVAHIRPKSMYHDIASTVQNSVSSENRN